MGPEFAEGLIAAAGEGQPLDQRIVAADDLVRAGYFDAARPILEALAQHPPVARTARRLMAVCQQLQRWGTKGELERLGVEESAPDFMSDAQMLLARQPGASKVLFVFTGAARMFWVTLQLMHQLIPRRDCHVVYLRDEQGFAYLTGLRELGHDYESTVEGFGRLAASLEAREIYCIGSSAGGFGAMRYGLDLGARSVLAFSARTDWSDTAANPTNPILAAIVEQNRRAFVDLRALYSEAPSPPQVTLVFGGANEADAAASRWMADLPTVRLHPIADYDRHDVIAETIATGTFRPLLEETLYGGPSTCCLAMSP